jgi:hypothetical protein
VECINLFFVFKASTDSNPEPLVQHKNGNENIQMLSTKTSEVSNAISTPPSSNKSDAAEDEINKLLSNQNSLQDFIKQYRTLFNV